MSRFTLHQGDCLTVLPQLRVSSIQTCVTSPPYHKLRNYNAAGQLGQERTVAEYVSNLVAVFRQVRRVLRADGSLWVNIGDSYVRSDNKRQGLKKGDLAGVPWHLALALKEEGWYLRSSIIWSRSNVCPESVTDRPTKSHEYLLLLSPSRRYYYDAAAIREPVAESTLTRHKTAQKALGGTETGEYKADALVNSVNPKYRQKTPEEISARGRNKRTVWTCASGRSHNRHSATFPEALITPCILAGCPVGGVILDPFAGTATTGVAALRHGRDFVGIELNEEYLEIAQERLERLA